VRNAFRYAHAGQRDEALGWADLAREEAELANARFRDKQR
jgi:hypothetical protein